MAKGNVAAEPSMEEILASIRRIIADEEPGSAAKSQDFISEPLPDEGEDYEQDSTSSARGDVLDLGAEEEGATETIPAKPVVPVDMDDVSFDAFAKEQAITTPVTKPPAKNDWNETVNKPAQQQQPQQQYQPLPRPLPAPLGNDGLISAHTDSAVSAAFNSLASAIFSSEPRTIEDLTKDMLKPMLKQWLDENLSSMVERIVKDEIERVARGGRR